MSGPVPISPLSAAIEVVYPARNPSEVWRSGSVSSKISPMQTIREEEEDAEELELTAVSSHGSSVDSNDQKSCHTEMEHSEDISPELAEFVAKIRAAIQQQGEDIRMRSTNSKAVELQEEKKLTIQSKAGSNAARNSLIFLRDKASMGVLNAKAGGRKISKGFKSAANRGKHGASEQKPASDLLEPKSKQPCNEPTEEDIDPCPSDDADGEDVPLLSSQLSSLNSSSDKVSRNGARLSTWGLYLPDAKLFSGKTVSIARRTGSSQAESARLIFQSLRIGRKRSGWFRIDG
ncbi:hypothetical protein HRR83_003867 [Exophiala dermatitidis]|uniref:Uncharacterized protein n=1 Tax=Exophiala dermatitidis TaxID=5970 RepID=A0AAN6IXI1_EXODE|nr:hypothetical protein HRR74_002749 [Exophiala dermatitidis]KAJ4529493.1 hypothetical protein HRR73_000518 [Exophiala dermatitidis]KAJ4543849.1 hypothetical protein HRR76_001909 [Exophiala dermatitidis]KAJ4549027.1 hypothetical protein HRR77_003905 [Exophiala dermatitidis]KAJ4575315.1 hypothetical protein HRR79_002239 [Exophiala dermatitidis]